MKAKTYLLYLSLNDEYLALEIDNGKIKIDTNCELEESAKMLFDYLCDHCGGEQVISALAAEFDEKIELPLNPFFKKVDNNGGRPV